LKYKNAEGVFFQKNTFVLKNIKIYIQLILRCYAALINLCNAT